MLAADLASWLALSPVSSEQETELTRLLEVATLHLHYRVEDTSHPLAQQAILMQAARFYKRKNSPEGTLDMGGFSTNVRSLDPDIEALIAPIRRHGWA